MNEKVFLVVVLVVFPSLLMVPLVIGNFWVSEVVVIEVTAVEERSLILIKDTKIIGKNSDLMIVGQDHGIEVGKIYRLELQGTYFMKFKLIKKEIIS